MIKKNYMEKIILNSTKVAIDDLVKLAIVGDYRLWVDYDNEVDILYINFDRPQKAYDAIQEKGIIKRKRKGKIIGFTILNASSYRTKS